MDPILLGGGALLALYALSNTSQSQTDPGNGGGTVTKMPIPSTFIFPKTGARALGLTNGTLEDSINNPAFDLNNVNSFANYNYVMNVLDTLGYDVDNISTEAINACVYRVSVYNWYYLLKAIVNDDETLCMLDAAAYLVIDEWIKTFGYVKISGVNKSGLCPPVCDQRNRFAKYDPMTHQDTYIMGVGIIDDVVEVGKWILNNLDKITQAIDWLKGLGWFGADRNIADGMEEWAISEGVGVPEAASMADYINNNRNYWDAAIVLHTYLVFHPSVLSNFTPVYLYD